MPADLILLAICGAFALLLGTLYVGWDRRREIGRQHRALRSFYERE